MKKIVIFAAITLLSIGYIFSQELKWETDEEKSYKIPVGLCTWDDLVQSEFNYLLREYSINVILDANATVELAKVLENQPNSHYEIEAFFAAWDEESLKQLPHFYAFVKTMETKYQQPIEFKLIGCNREYECGSLGDPEAMPYFKVYRISENGERTLVGIISEAPAKSYEADVLNIIKH